VQSWNNIINTALLGTDKKVPDTIDMPEAAASAFALIHANEAADKEEKFLQSAALLYNYKQCGLMPLKKETVIAAAAQPETKPYCSNLSTQVLKDIFFEESIPLLLFWLKHCQAAGQLVKPELLPAVLAAGADNKKLQPYIAACTGNRGEWLCHFNEGWHFSKQQPAAEQWQTGTPEQRKAVLKETRMTDLVVANEWLQQSWAQEDAASKLAFLEILSDTINSEDIPFLEKLSTEKSKKVKEEALYLLKCIPGSPVVLQYQQLLKAAVILKKEKALLGFSSKTVLQWQLPAAIPEEIFKTGIEKLSPSKDLPDEHFIIYQLMQHVPPSFWEEQLDGSPEQIIKLLQKDTTGKKMLFALQTAIKNFKDKNWALAMMQHSGIFYAELLPLLATAQQEFYSNRFFEQHAALIVQYAVQRSDEWGHELANNIMRYTAKNTYQYPRSFYNQHIHLLPQTAGQDLEKFSPTETYMQNMWSNTSEYIVKLLQLKLQIIQSFNQ
jgi:Family of unknown function (DUF5691)